MVIVAQRQSARLWPWRSGFQNSSITPNYSSVAEGISTALTQRRHWFDSSQNYQYADIAQLVERGPSKSDVAGSNPVIRSKQCPYRLVA